MSRFLVDSRSLLAVRDALGRLHDELLQMHTVILARRGTLGGHALEGELEHFCGTWHYGVCEIGDEVARLMDRLAEAAAAYERIERRVTSAGQVGHGAGPAGAPSGSGTTVIGGPPPPPPHGSGSSSGSGTTVIGGPPPHPSGSGIVVVDDHPRRPAPGPAAAMSFASQ